MLIFSNLYLWKESLNLEFDSFKMFTTVYWSMASHSRRQQSLKLLSNTECFCSCARIGKCILLHMSRAKSVMM